MSNPSYRGVILEVNQSTKKFMNHTSLYDYRGVRFRYIVVFYTTVKLQGAWIKKKILAGYDKVSRILKIVDNTSYRSIHKLTINGHPFDLTKDEKAIKAYGMVME